MDGAIEIGRFDQSGWFLADSYVLHKTVRAGFGLRISLDFRFIPKERISSDNDEDATRRPFFLSIAEWRRIGSSTLITTQESMHGFNPAAKKDPYTIGYPVRISLIDAGHADDLPSQSMPPDVVSCDRDVAPAFVAGKLGISIDELRRLLGNRPWPRLAYRILQGAERDDIIRHVLERIDMAELRVVGDNDGTVWERGWGEILDRITAQGFDPSLLSPQYFDQHRIMRFGGHYIDATNNAFVKAYDDLLRRLVLARYLEGVTRVVELGCGTGTSPADPC